MCTEKHLLDKNMYTNRLNMGLPLKAQDEKRIHRVETHWLSSKEKVADTMVSKEGHADCLLEDERTHQLISLRYQSKLCFLLPIP